MDHPIFVIDTETAGINMPPCEVGIIEVDWELDIVRSWDSLIDPQCHILASASAIHGLVDEDVADAPTLTQWSMMTPNPLLYSGAVAPYIVGHKVRFDIGVMGPEIPADALPSCTLKMARNLFPDLAEEGDNHQLQTLMYRFGLYKDPLLAAEAGGVAHRVLYDIRCCIVFMRFLRRHFGFSTQQVLDEGRKPLSKETPMWFSKYKGTRLKDLDIGFVAWLRRQSDMDPELIEALAFFPPTR